MSFWRSAGLGGALLLVVAAAVNAQDAVRDKVRAYRAAHEKEIVGELDGLLALPNVATRVAYVERNADQLTTLLERRGFAVQRLSAGPGTPPALYGELRVPGAQRTLMFYAHYDGQPVGQKGWLSDPFKPVLRSGPLGGPNVKEIDLTSALTPKSGPLDPEWRLYARSASDDKSPIVAILTALDALRASGLQPSVNLKLFLEGEEEQGSHNLGSILRRNAELLAADAWLLCDGPVHPTRRMQLYFGARGVAGLELTVYGPIRPLHSGHYGNWAPNPAVELAHLIAELRDEEGRILVPRLPRAPHGHEPARLPRRGHARRARDGRPRDSGPHAGRQRTHVHLHRHPEIPDDRRAHGQPRQQPAWDQREFKVAESVGWDRGVRGIDGGDGRGVGAVRAEFRR